MKPRNGQNKNPMTGYPTSAFFLVWTVPDELILSSLGWIPGFLGYLKSVNQT